jgi:hypothetical protein
MVQRNENKVIPNGKTLQQEEDALVIKEDISLDKERDIF